MAVSSSRSTPSARRRFRRQPRGSRRRLVALGGAGAAGRRLRQEGQSAAAAAGDPQRHHDLVVAQRGNQLVLRFAYPQTTTARAKLPGLAAVEVGAMTRPVPPRREHLPIVDAREFTGRRRRRVATLRGAELQSAIEGGQVVVRLPLPEVPPAPRPLPPPRRASAPPARDAPAPAATPAADRARSTSTPCAPSPRAARRPRCPTSHGSCPQAPPRPRRPAPSSRAPTASRCRGAPSAPGVAGFAVYRRPAASRSYGEPLATPPATARELPRHHRPLRRALHLHRHRARCHASRGWRARSARRARSATRTASRRRRRRTSWRCRSRAAVSLVWQASPDTDAVGYLVYRQDPGAEFRKLTAEPITDLKYADSGLTPGLLFRYRVTAVDAAGNEGPPTPVVGGTAAGIKARSDDRVVQVDRRRQRLPRPRRAAGDARVGDHPRLVPARRLAGRRRPLHVAPEAGRGAAAMDLLERRRRPGGALRERHPLRRAARLPPRLGGAAVTVAPAPAPSRRGSSQTTRSQLEMAPPPRRRGPSSFTSPARRLGDRPSACRTRSSPGSDPPDASPVSTLGPPIRRHRALRRSRRQRQLRALPSEHEPRHPHLGARRRGRDPRLRQRRARRGGGGRRDRQLELPVRARTKGGFVLTVDGEIAADGRRIARWTMAGDARVLARSRPSRAPSAPCPRRCGRRRRDLDLRECCEAGPGARGQTVRRHRILEHGCGGNQQGFRVAPAPLRHPNRAERVLGGRQTRQCRSPYCAFLKAMLSCASASAPASR